MKKLLLVVLATSFLASSIAFSKEKAKSKPSSDTGFKYGIGLDVINGNQQTLRIPFQIEEGLIVEARTKFATDNTNGLGLDFGAGVYYSLSPLVSVGGYFDVFDNPSINQTGVRIGGGVKVEQFVSKNLSFAFEIGYENSTQKIVATTTTLQPYSLITGRIYF